MHLLRQKCLGVARDQLSKFSLSLPFVVMFLSFFATLFSLPSSFFLPFFPLALSQFLSPFLVLLFFALRQCAAFLSGEAGQGKEERRKEQKKSQKSTHVFQTHCWSIVGQR